MIEILYERERNFVLGVDGSTGCFWWSFLSIVWEGVGFCGRVIVGFAN